MHLTGDQFRINVDGVSGDVFSSVEIPAKDSIYILAEVTVDPNSALTPYVIIDDIQFVTNNETKTMHLQAFGQNAHFHYGELIENAQTWTNDLPHVVIARDTVPGVYVKCNGNLTINPGCKVFFANNAAIFVEGKLKAEATSWSDSIVFRGVRLESFYINKPGQWFGLVFLRNNTCVPEGTFNHCVVRESNFGIYVGAGLSNNLNDYLDQSKSPVVDIQKSIVKNSLTSCLFGFNGKITADNSLFYTSGDHLVQLGLGGEYQFNNCTFYNTGSRFVEHKKEALLISNFASDGTNLYAAPITNSFANNCVVYGSLESEISFNKLDGTGYDMPFAFSLIKNKVDTFNFYTPASSGNLFNADPRFKNPTDDNFTPNDSSGYFSPIIDFSPSGISTDLFDKPRPVSKTSNGNKFDVGAVEAQ